MKQCRRKRRIFWRIYAQSLLLLLAVGVSLAIAAWLSNTGGTWRKTNERLGHSLGTELELSGPTAEFQRRVEQAAALMDVSIAVYRDDGTPLALAGEHTSAPLDADEIPRDGGSDKSIRDGWVWSVAVPLDEAGSVYAIIAQDSSAHAARGVITLLLVLLASGVVLYPLARSIARPLEQVAAAADRLGNGNLSTRVHLSRRDEIGELGESFNRMAEGIERLVTSEKELLANVSHELRTPLARIRVALELAGETRDTEKVRRRLRSIEEDVVELDWLVEDVLVAARLDLARSGQMEVADFIVRSGSLAVGELLESAAERFQTAHPEAEVTIDVAKDTWLDADAALLHRVLTNLLENAAKYGVAPNAEGARVALAARPSGDNVEITVRDFGRGIDPGDHERVFEPFFRGDRSRSDGSGVGLGLALSRRIVDAHQGRLYAEDSRPGARFVLELPRSG